MIHIKPGVSIDENEITYEYMRASGPGGQNVNKVSTAVRLRYDVRSSGSVPENVKMRLASIAGSRITNDGILIIESSTFRTQERNKQEALSRLIELVNKASNEPKPRRKTKPSLRSKKKRLEIKKQRGMIKRQRKPVKFSEE